jgi:hypothetical protein
MGEAGFAGQIIAEESMSEHSQLSGPMSVP